MIQLTCLFWTRVCLRHMQHGAVALGSSHVLGGPPRRNSVLRSLAGLNLVRERDVTA